MGKQETFEITKDHGKLLKSFYISWDDCEYGAPCVDPKRPYGNSDVEGDIAEILGWEFDKDEGLSSEQIMKAAKIHKEMQDVLQIVVSTGRFKTGSYQKEDSYDAMSWKLIKE